MSLPSSMADFVPCDRLLQKAHLLLHTEAFTVKLSEVFPSRLH